MSDFVFTTVGNVGFNVPEPPGQLIISGDILTTQPVVDEWAPQLDITTYELALCIPAILGASVEALPYYARRHFRRAGPVP